MTYYFAGLATLLGVVSACVLVLAAPIMLSPRYSPLLGIKDLMLAFALGGVLSMGLGFDFGWKAHGIVS